MINTDYKTTVQRVADRLQGLHRWRRIYLMPVVYKCRWCGETFFIQKSLMDTKGILEEIEKMKNRRDCKGVKSNEKRIV